jgi:hypothetical protein
MYILVRVSDNVIVGSGHNAMNAIEASKQGRRIYEIDDADFDQSMLGQQITEFKVIE